MSARLSGGSAWVLYPVAALTMLFVIAPLAVVVAMSVSGSAFATFPPRGFTLAWYGRVLQDPDFLASLAFSATLAAAATAGALALGLPAAFALTRCALPGRQAFRMLLLSPLIFPVLVIGVALLRLFSDWNSNSAPLNLLIAHILVTSPYVVRTVSASLLLADASLEEAARTLGAGWWRVLRRVTIPQIAPGLAAGALFAFMVSFDNYPVSMWLADAQNVPMPMLIFRLVGSIFTPAVPAMSTLMILIAFVVVVVMERLVGLRRAMAM
ncbi:MAG: ABC transporter permease [Acetobacteraceae bacterium]|nr:ABC transporter permease [Acetobacteraceae bacterium]